MQESFAPWPLLDRTRDPRDCHLAVDLKGTLMRRKAVSRHRLERADGRVINLSSVNGTRLTHPGETSPRLARAGVRGCAEELATERIVASVAVSR